MFNSTLYRPRKEILDGMWQFPEAQPAKQGQWHESLLGMKQNEEKQMKETELKQSQPAEVWYDRLTPVALRARSPSRDVRVDLSRGRPKKRWAEPSPAVSPRRRGARGRKIKMTR